MTRDESQAWRIPVILSDFIDREALEEIADQLNIRAEIESEISEGRLRGSEVAAGIEKFLTMKVSQTDEKSASRRFGPKPRIAQLQLVLVHLIRSQRLRDVVQEFWPDFHVGNAETYDQELKASGEKFTGRAQWLIKERHWVVIEGEWVSAADESSWRLKLMRVGRHGDYYDTAMVDVADTYPVCVLLDRAHPSDGLTMRGKRLRQAGASNRATVFGTAEAWSETDGLIVEPVAIFDRKASEEPTFTWGEKWYGQRYQKPPD